MVRAAGAITGAKRKDMAAQEKYNLKPVKKRKAHHTPEELAVFPGHATIVHFSTKLRDNKYFKTGVIGVIFLAGILVGIQTYEITDPEFLKTLSVMDTIVLDIFVLEVFVKLFAEGKLPWLFFTDAWNAFDFAIVAVGFMPFGGNAVTALRLVRLLRVLKLVRALPKLRILVMGLLKSLSSIAYIGLLLMMLFYLYAVLAVSTFGENDPVQLGTLHIAVLTLFRCATLEDWTDVMYTAMQGCANYGYGGMEDLCVKSSANPLMGAIYFVSFVILSSMMILNLFIGVITSSMQDAKADLQAEADAEAAANAEGDEEEGEDPEEILEERLSELAELMAAITREINELADLEKERASEMVVNLAQGDIFEQERHGIKDHFRESPTPMQVVDLSSNEHK